MWGASIDSAKWINWAAMEGYEPRIMEATQHTLMFRGSRRQGWEQGWWRVCFTSWSLHLCTSLSALRQHVAHSCRDRQQPSEKRKKKFNLVLACVNNLEAQAIPLSPKLLQLLGPESCQTTVPDDHDALCFQHIYFYCYHRLWWADTDFHQSQEYYLPFTQLLWFSSLSSLQKIITDYWLWKWCWK